MGLFSRKHPAERLYKADQAVRKFAKGKKKLSNREHRIFDGLLKKRAKAMSDVCGVKIGSISSKDYKKFLKKQKKNK